MLKISFVKKNNKNCPNNLNIYTTDTRNKLTEDGERIGIDEII